MHFCALKAAGESMINPTLYSRVNIIGSIKYFRNMIKNNVNKFIFLHQVLFMENPKTKYINEDHPLSP